ncbi:ribosome recycling factor [bacterium endosymbiont of Bathymodiolus sp. 5 South]|jgi:ribosome recycling factor|uniref:ribosome recycling factor n=1 Tax=bacterium endosymbiont of Bathymodiolus sp. 5 South TaxID=1181670 RepID=UPI000255FED3|nr:ribosome recycling factor [bacterium endosymbiont of Bathymodiolus sp. 5 South]CAC9433813.1 Ribosome recycling factor [uncultured Gammaproteobacteria bacterium]CAC9435066.1 Ribosome recycling factor [uncultured Gammaproteobacteria bacterium]CAC9439428.1 Ribosome recycling factor [uncultured Gammaproteobacteria bacterium]CAC9650145.1 Ribosome recycling factor [uncultured Gammaproteobacteria bacterium]SHN90619.1 Ribosome recycling factor [bacterium endosymbiont of Bathymodiolus sp. 5 South]
MLNEIQQDAKARMTKSLASLENDFSKIRAGRAHPSLLEQIQVDYYGSMVPISQVANISAEDSRTLKVSPWEKEMVAVVEKAIMTSDLGLNPQTLGQVMRIPLPPLTEERRRELVRIVKDEAEQAKVAVRNIRRDANSDFKELLKDKEVSADEAHKAEENIQKLTDEFIKSIDEKLDEKENSLLEI